MPHNKFPELPSRDELTVNEETGFPFVPVGIEVYANGAGRYTAVGQLAYGPGTFSPDTTGIQSSEHAQEIRNRRTELAEQRLREDIAKITNVEDAISAFSHAGALLWQQLVLNKDADDRTRITAYKELGKRMGIVPDRDRAYAEKQGASIHVKGLTPDVLTKLRELADAMRPIDSQVEDVHPQVIDSSFQSPLD